ncbi:MAG: hypothetical protein ACI97P_000447 [Arcticibacterium sp.]|jgi:hypothetical protein
MAEVFVLILAKQVGIAFWGKTLGIFFLTSHLFKLAPHRLFFMCSTNIFDKNSVFNQSGS